MPPRKAAARGKISIDEAFHKLMPLLGPHGAVELMNAALRDPRRARLWCNGKVVDPGFIRTHLVVRARLMAKRRWTAEIRATRALDKPVEAYTWQTEAKQIEALKPRLPGRLLLLRLWSSRQPIGLVDGGRGYGPRRRDQTAQGLGRSPSRARTQA